MVFTSVTAVDSESAPIAESSSTSQEETLLPASSLRIGSDAKPKGTRSVGQTALPVRQENVSFNLSISADEQAAKSQVQLPYMHQGARSASSKDTTSAATGNTLFFIDEDDPDWDDDDLDDDLDI
ncbi:hypothetical protein BBJ28_00022883 [Nothophytophthora sp. Chile5]|nr:hypothetical protein BBJ28_00022883 [Nothophytophthora sp. Chile5]